MACIQANGTYTLTNLKGGTSIDLSGGDNVSSTSITLPYTRCSLYLTEHGSTVIGFTSHGGPNQRVRISSVVRSISDRRLRHDR